MNIQDSQPIKGTLRSAKLASAAPSADNSVIEEARRARANIQKDTPSFKGGPADNSRISRPGDAPEEDFKEENQYSVFLESINDIDFQELEDIPKHKILVNKENKVLNPESITLSKGSSNVYEGGSNKRNREGGKNSKRDRGNNRHEKEKEN
jgi:hypothetical protein